MIVYLNGEWLEADRARLPIDDRGFLYGDAVFETGRLFRGGYFRLEEHLARLESGAERMRLHPPPREELARVARELAERNRMREGSLRITVTRGGRGGPTVLATLSPLAEGWEEAAARGWHVVTSDIAHPSADSLATVKTTGRAYGLVARLEAQEVGADDALLLSPQGEVTEGPTWNVFWRRGNTLYTPAAALGVLEGVTRTAIARELAPAAGLEVREGLYPRVALDDAEEVFATMTSSGIVPFASLDGRDLPAEGRTAAARLRDLYWALVAREVAGEPEPDG